LTAEDGEGGEEGVEAIDDLRREGGVSVCFPVLFGKECEGGEEDMTCGRERRFVLVISNLLISEEIIKNVKV
jgi:hypothetical protein